jgi:para-nitrobenzyl esterase
MCFRKGLPVLVIAAAVCAGAQSNLVVVTRSGPVQGAPSSDSKIRMFKGIPYAAPPVGNLRWKPPQPVAPWSTPRAGMGFGSRCMQGRIFPDMIFRDPGPSEDCLTLNVWTPAVSAEERLPVMVWVYGGGFAGGGTSEPRQDGEALAHKGVVVVSMNYRLGIFGFFVHRDLAKESPHHAAGNYGLLDQAAALQWVHDNIAAFGGDPSIVTIFGESAGSFSVSGLMASPLSKPLIARAIGESGALFGRGLQRGTVAQADEADRQFAREHLGTDSLEELRAKPASELLEATLKARSGIRFSTVVDGYFLPETAAAIYESGKQAHVPLLAGWNAAEQSSTNIFGKGEKTAARYRAWVTEHFGEHADAILAAYPANSDQEAQDSAQALASDQFIAFSTWKWIETHLETGHSPVWRYLFEDAPPMREGPSRGAYHSAEIEFVFHNLKYKDLPWRPVDEKLSDLMSTYWTNFAKTGDPNGRDLPKWPQYSQETNYQVMHLKENAKAAPATDRARYQALEKIPPQT